jgi:hypothetical protein
VGSRGGGGSQDLSSEETSRSRKWMRGTGGGKRKGTSREARGLVASGLLVVAVEGRGPCDARTWGIGLFRGQHGRPPYSIVNEFLKMFKQVREECR